MYEKVHLMINFHEFVFKKNNYFYSISYYLPPEIIELAFGLGTLRETPFRKTKYRNHRNSPTEPRKQKREKIELFVTYLIDNDKHKNPMEKIYT